jgi:hypothetical protein
MRVELWAEQWLEQRSDGWYLCGKDKATHVNNLDEKGRGVCKVAIKQAVVSPRPWHIGFADHGMGRGNFAVLDSNGDVVCENVSQKDAEYIVGLTK